MDGENRTLKTVEPNGRIAFCVWWAYAWRSILCSAGAGAIIGISAAVLRRFDVVDIPKGIVLLLSIIAGCATSVWAMNMVLQLRFKHFRLLIEDKTPEADGSR